MTFDGVALGDSIAGVVVLSNVPLPVLLRFITESVKLVVTLVTFSIGSNVLITFSYTVVTVFVTFASTVEVSFRKSVEGVNVTF